MFDLNFDFTTPELPCGRVTRLQTKVKANSQHDSRQRGHNQSSNAPPDNADLRTLHLALGTVDVRNALAQVELGILLVPDAFNLDEGSVRARIALSTLVAEDAAF